MSDFLKDCFQKIGWEKDHVSFGDLPLFLKAMAYRFPFENRAVLAKENYKITKEEPMATSAQRSARRPMLRSKWFPLFCLA